MKPAYFAAAALAAFAMTPATAATFTSSFGFGGPPPAGSYCNTNTNTTAFATGDVLGYTDQLCIGGFTVALDTTAQTITLTNIIGSPFGNYDYAQLEITDISEVTIASLSTLQFLPIYNPDPGLGAATPTPGLSFTGSSILITFDSIGGENFNFGNDGGQAIFAYNSTAVVPEPASWAMLIAGFGLVGAAMRRRSVATA